jgi:hypothetical protein
MRFLQTTGQLALVLATMQWAYQLMMLGHSKWGWAGAVLGLISSPALLPFSPFTAWMFFGATDLIWFYSLLGIAVTGVGLEALLRPRIVSDYPTR